MAITRGRRRARDLHSPPGVPRQLTPSLFVATSLAFAVPGVAVAQEGAAALHGPRTNSTHLDPAGDEQVSLGLPTPSSDHSGWATFGGHAGFFAGTAITAALIVASLDDPSLRPYAGGAGLISTAGLTALGAWRVSVWADSGDWDPDVGWGLAGVFPGMSAGMVAAAGTLMAIDPVAPLGTRLTVLGVGLAAGATVGYLAFRGMAEARGNAGWETFAFWVGFFISEVVALASIAGSGPPNTRTGLALAGIPVGAALSTATVHALLR